VETRARILPSDPQTFLTGLSQDESGIIAAASNILGGHQWSCSQLEGQRTYDGWRLGGVDHIVFLDSRSIPMMTAVHLDAEE
jgi:hypothetical protein